MNNELCFKSARELTQLVQTRQVSAEETLHCFLEHIETVNPTVNAIVTLAPEHALDLARNVDAKLAHGEPVGALAGLPIAHKDLVDTKGIRTTYGSRIYANHIPTSDDLLVTRANEAGAITLGKTNTPEFGAGSQTFNEVFGVTKNPYDLSKTCGGSSGGAAVSLATRMLPIADGSDLGGSLRNPASYCNVVGFRTSTGRVPGDWFSMAVSGPMARTVDDCALLLNVISEPSGNSAASSGLASVDFTANLERDFKQVKIAVSADFNGQLPVDAKVRNVVDAAAATFKNMGCEVSEVCPDFTGADNVFKTLRAWLYAHKHRDNLATHRELYKDTIIWNVEQGLQLTGEDISNAEVARADLFQRVQQFLEDFEFLILPVTQIPPFDLNKETIDSIEGQPMHTYIDWMKSCYYISTTGLPSISVPAGFTDTGLPVGIQIIGRHHQDHAVLQLAKAFESATNYWQQLPPLLK